MWGRMVPEVTAMTTSTRMSGAERAGRKLGQLWHRLVQCDRQATRWLIQAGVPVPLVTALAWGMKLAVLALALYVAFWLALLLVFAFAGAWLLRQPGWDIDEDEDKPQWRDGLDGYGLYRRGRRIDPGGGGDA